MSLGTADVPTTVRHALDRLSAAPGPVGREAFAVLVDRSPRPGAGGHCHGEAGR